MQNLEIAIGLIPIIFGILGSILAILSFMDNEIIESFGRLAHNIPNSEIMKTQAGVLIVVGFIIIIGYMIQAVFSYFMYDNFISGIIYTKMLIDMLI